MIQWRIYSSEFQQHFQQVKRTEKMWKTILDWMKVSELDFFFKCYVPTANNCELQFILLTYFARLVFLLWREFEINFAAFCLLCLLRACLNGKHRVWFIAFYTFFYRSDNMKNHQYLPIKSAQFWMNCPNGNLISEYLLWYSFGQFFVRSY